MFEKFCFQNYCASLVHYHVEIQVLWHADLVVWVRVTYATTIKSEVGDPTTTNKHHPPRHHVHMYICVVALLPQGEMMKLMEIVTVSRQNFCRDTFHSKGVHSRFDLSFYEAEILLHFTGDEKIFIQIIVISNVAY